MHWGRGCTSTRPVPVPMLVWAAVLVGAEREKRAKQQRATGGANVVVACPKLTCQVGQGVGQLAASAPFAAPSVPEATAMLQ